jgi:lipoprotein
MKKFILFFVLILLFSCSTATTEKLERKLQSRMGMPESDLVDLLGPPDQVYKLDDKKYLTYITSNTSYVPQTVHNTTVGNQIQTNVYGGYSRSWYCKVTYIVEKGVIVSWRYEGNSCLSY